MIQFQSDVAVLPKDTMADWQKPETPKIIQTVADISIPESIFIVEQYES